MTAAWTEAMKLQRPLPDGSLGIVGHGGKTDEPQEIPTMPSDQLL